MLGLPKATMLARSKPLSKKAVFERFKPSPASRKLFDEQINRMAIVAEISPQTVAIKQGGDVAAIYVVQVILKTAECDKKNIALLSKLIDQNMLFMLQYGDMVQLAVYRADKVLMSECRPLEEWRLTLSGLDLDTVWDNLVAEAFGINLSADTNLDATIAENDRREKLQKQIAALEKKAMSEKQPRKKWELAEEIKSLRGELEELQ